MPNKKNIDCLRRGCGAAFAAYKRWRGMSRTARSRNNEVAAQRTRDAAVVASSLAQFGIQHAGADADLARGRYAAYTDTQPAMSSLPALTLPFGVQLLPNLMLSMPQAPQSVAQAGLLPGPLAQAERFDRGSDYITSSRSASNAAELQGTA